MSFTVDLYKAIAEDMQKGSVNGAPFASRLIRCGNGALVIYAINMITGMKAAYFAVGTAAPKNVFPSWKGIEIGLARFPAYSVNQEYVGLTQIPQCAEYIFEIVVEDIRASVDAAASADDALAVIVSVLAKWREFFQAEHDGVRRPAASLPPLMLRTSSGSSCPLPLLLRLPRSTRAVSSIPTPIRVLMHGRPTIVSSTTCG